MTEPTIPLTSLLQQQDWLRRLARSLVHDSAAEDLVQDTLRIALDGDAPRAQSAGRLRGWLRVVATRRAAETWRQDAGRAARERSVAQESPSETPDVSGELERAELKRFLADAVMQLDKPLRNVVVLRFYEGCSHRDLAAQLGITEALARQRASRACAALRERLDRRSSGDRTVWMSALAPWAGHAPRASASLPALAALGVAVAALGIALVLSALGWRPGAPAVATAVGAVAPIEIEDEIALESPGPVDTDQRTSGIADPRQATGPSGEAPASTRRRIAFPLPLADQRATLDVLAIWDDTEEPAPFQRLHAFGRATLATDSGGRVRFADLPAGYGGISNLQGSHLNLKLEPGEVRSLTFRMRRDFAVQGSVVDEAGRTVQDASVLISVSSNGSSEEAVRADAAGRFRLEGLSGAVIVSAAHPTAGTSLGHLLNQSLVSEIRREHGTEDGDDLEIVLSGGAGALAGTVVDEEGVPVEGAQVQFIPKPAVELGRHERIVRAGTSTDEKGHFEMAVLRSGPGTWSVRTAFHGVNTGPISIAKAVTTELSIQLDAGLTVRGRVLNASNGEPVPKAIVGVGERGEPTMRAAETDDQGAFEIVHVTREAAQLWVEVQRNRVLAQPFLPAESDSGELVLRVEPLTQPVYGSVVDDSGVPLEGYGVRAVGGDQSSFTARVDSQGAFRIEHAPLDASAVEVSRPRSESNDDRVVMLVTECLPQASALDLVVPAAKLAMGRLIGRVVTSKGAAVPSFDAELEAMDGSNWLLADGQQAGHFRFEEVALGRHALVIRAAGYAEHLQMIDVKAAETLDLGTMTLTAGATFQLDLTFEAPPSTDTEGRTPSIDLYEIRREDDGVQQRLYLGEAQSGLARYGPVPVMANGSTRLLFEGAGFHRELEIEVEPDGSTVQTLQLGSPSLTSVALEYPDGAPAAEGSERDVLTFGLSWTLLNAEGRALRRSYRPRPFRRGRRLRLHGLEPSATYVLKAEDIEGRSGRVRILGGSAAVIRLRRQ